MLWHYACKIYKNDSVLQFGYVSEKTLPLMRIQTIPLAPVCSHDGTNKWFGFIPCYTLQSKPLKTWVFEFHYVLNYSTHCTIAV